VGNGADDQLPDLVGREHDIALVRRFVERSARDGGALLLSGDAGVGKTALLETAVAHGRSVGVRILRATGTQFEATVSFAGLHQVLYPLRGSVAELARPWKVALDAAFGLARTPPADRLVVSTAVLELLDHSARTNPVLVVVDDLPWLDPVSVAALGFVARRAAGTRVGVLAAARTGEPQPLDRSGIPTHDLRPLSPQASARLLALRYPALSPRVSKRLLEEARGNPLALLELPTPPTSPVARCPTWTPPSAASGWRPARPGPSGPRWRRATSTASASAPTRCGARCATAARAGR
jgi:AAA ATPase domain